MDKIDFVVTWVDGSDPQWLAAKNRYERMEPNPELLSKEANAECRYRDLGFLRYWFRGVEQFAPWVNKVFFITCGQKPAWLNVNHPKLVCVNHRDFIPERYLPTFNSNTIELNLHRIKDLSEHFVLFNDDLFLLKEISPSFFFRNGDPVLHSTLRFPHFCGINNWGRVQFNDYCIISENFDESDSIWKYRRKWFSISDLGMRKAISNMIRFLANKSLSVSNYAHVAQPHLKSTIADVWEKCPLYMDVASSHKFRSDNQVNHWLFCAWNQALGKFYPAALNKKGRSVMISSERLDWIVTAITKQRYFMICLNDSLDNEDVSYCDERIIPAFERILPKQSSFELER